MSQSIADVRVLPMSGDEFEGRTAEHVQSEFFLKELPSREAGRYFYRTAGLNAEPGTIVLFQYANKIIACAVFDGSERFDQPQGDYHGALNFDINSIRVFDPIGPEIMNAVWPDDFEGFGRVKAKLAHHRFSQFEQHLTGVRVPLLSVNDWNYRFEQSVQKALTRTTEDRMSRISAASPLPKRITVTATVFDRNPDVVAAVLHRANGVCEQCEKPAPFIRRSDGTPYLEVHHEHRLADGGEDSVTNAVALCPNCHRQAHYA